MPRSLNGRRSLAPTPRYRHKQIYFLANEKSQSLLNDGIDAASIYMSAERLADMQAMLKHFGPDSFKDFQAKMHSLTPQGEAWRKQIQTLFVAGDAAILTERSGRTCRMRCGLSGPTLEDRQETFLK